jgi:hypothetical protein
VGGRTRARGGERMFGGVTGLGWKERTGEGGSEDRSGMGGKQRRKSA